MKREAYISDCGSYRYWLTRAWDISRPSMNFIMLNPSTADASEDDPTIRKCVGFAERLGFGRIVVTNLFAFRATDPKALKKAGYPVGPENDEWIVRAAATFTICAWGANARGLSRPARVLDILRALGVEPQALRVAEDGTPWHPLMLPYSSVPQRLGAAVAERSGLAEAPEPDNPKHSIEEPSWHP